MKCEASSKVLGNPWNAWGLIMWMLFLLIVMMILVSAFM